MYIVLSLLVNILLMFCNVYNCCICFTIVQWLFVVCCFFFRYSVYNIFYCLIFCYNRCFTDTPSSHFIVAILALRRRRRGFCFSRRGRAVAAQAYTVLSWRPLARIVKFHWATLTQRPLARIVKFHCCNTNSTAFGQVRVS